MDEYIEVPKTTGDQALEQFGKKDLDISEKAKVAANDLRARQDAIVAEHEKQYANYLISNVEIQKIILALQKGDAETMLKILLAIPEVEDYMLK